MPGYLKIQSRDDFLRHNVVLAYMGGDYKKGRLRYRDFVLRGLTKKLANPMEEVKVGAILGSDSFVVWVKEHILDIKSLKEKDHPGLKELKRSVPVEEIAAAVAKEYGTYPKIILRTRSKKREARQVLIELSYRLNFRKKRLRELGEELGGISAGGVTHTHQRIQEKIENDKRLSRRVNRIYQEIIRQ